MPAPRIGGTSEGQVFPDENFNTLPLYRGSFPAEKSGYDKTAESFFVEIRECRFTRAALKRRRELFPGLL